MGEHLTALLLSFALYFCLAVTFYGWGLALMRLARVALSPIHPRTILVWLGWAACLWLFQLLHLFLPLNLYAVLPVFLVGLGFGIKPAFLSITRLVQDKQSRNYKALSIFILLFITAWVAFKSMLAPTIFDTGLYHLNTIRWINSYLIVPGLGNLHGRLAFNASFFTYAAALNFYPVFNQGRAIANSFLFLLTLLTMSLYLRPVLKKPSLVWQSHPFKYLPALLCLPILGYLVFKSDGFASPTPDMSIFLLQLTLFVLWTRSIAAHLEGERQQLFGMFEIIILAATSITVKLSNVLFDLAFILYGVLYLWVNYAGKLKVLLKPLIPAALIGLLWVGRGLILSGAMFFPSTFLSFPFEWAVPEEAMISEANWIFSWARLPNTHWQVVLGNWDWLLPWFETNISNLTLFGYPLATSLLLLGVVIVMSLIHKRSWPFWLEWSILLPLVLVLLYWFFSAPDLRFANASFFLLLVSALLLFFTAAQKTFKPKFYLLLFVLGVLLGNLQYLRIYALNFNTLADISWSGYQAVPQVALTQVRTDSGLMLYTPRAGEQCWDAPLPCTPYVNLTLSLREADDLSSGFIVTDYEDTRLSAP